nr:immunoglobulin heavy chain junction region [Mus musculus]MBK4195244.1 immunoglobulin heavy chain junction region [Mus musculus]MBK4195245.1 immunoglobulin heavy chain junction region [Mus musculus]MBK4195246.1 immunoglobulin heavy chain junction region [Mus musculus]
CTGNGDHYFDYW